MSEGSSMKLQRGIKVSEGREGRTYKYIFTACMKIFNKKKAEKSKVDFKSH